MDDKVVVFVSVMKTAVRILHFLFRANKCPVGGATDLILHSRKQNKPKINGPNHSNEKHFSNICGSIFDD